MKVDIIIPCAGTGAWVEETIKSVLRQTRPPAAIFLVDNGCPHDVYARIAQSLAPAGVRYIRFSERFQMTENWQRCLGVGDSPYFLMLHDDDVLLPDALECVEPILSADENLTCALLPHTFFETELDDGYNRRIGLARECNGAMASIPDKQRNFFLATSNAGHMSAMVCRRMPFGFPEESKWNPDQAFLFKHLAYGRVAVASSSGAGIRSHAEQLTTQMRRNSRISSETIAHLRRCLIFFIENRALTPEDIAGLNPVSGDGYVFRLAQASFSWPLRTGLVRFGRAILRIPELRPGIAKHHAWLEKLPWPCWAGATFAAELKYFTRERQVSP